MKSGHREYIADAHVNSTFQQAAFMRFSEQVLHRRFLDNTPLKNDTSKNLGWRQCLFMRLVPFKIPSTPLKIQDRIMVFGNYFKSCNKLHDQKNI